jgi:hypothetical protein
MSGVVDRSRYLYKAEKWFQMHAGKHPAIFFPVYSVFRGGSSQIVGPETEILIEGFPRSANSFAVVAFRRAQKGKVRVANNLHVPAQVVRASRLGVPTLLLLRKPADAVLSFAIRDPIPLGKALEYYVSFYEAVADYSDSYVIGLFEDVTSDYGGVIERVNEKFGTNFIPFRHTKRNVGRIFTKIETVYERNFSGASSLEEAVSRPSREREKAKRRLEVELESPRNRKLLDRAETVYERLAFGARR